MEVFYHGSNTLFEHFDLANALKGNGKIKFGYGVYVTSHYSSAAKYASRNKEETDFYVYTVEVPELKEGNYIAFKQCVHPEIIRRAEEKLGVRIPQKDQQDGKFFRKFLAKRLTGKTDFLGEKAAAEFLDSIGVVCIVWPYNWNKPEAGTNRAIFDESKIQILKIEQINKDEFQK